MFFRCLDATVNKSAIILFRVFLEKYAYVTKWFLCSDYCISDDNKPNDVVSFVLFPYISTMDEWNMIVSNMQKTDLKHCRTISPEFCEFTKQGYFFSFNFVLNKKSLLRKLVDNNNLDILLTKYISMTEEWTENTPNNASFYNKVNKHFKMLQNATKNKSFNYNLFRRVVYTCMLAGYLRFLLLKEKKDVKVFSWLSDRDAITSWQNGIYLDFYHVMSHCICDNMLKSEAEHFVNDAYLKNIENNQFYDGPNRIADFICGGLADYNYKSGCVSGLKQKCLMEEIISDNKYILIFNIHEDGIARITHTKQENLD